jgi:hypothetical protein
VRASSAFLTSGSETSIWSRRALDLRLGTPSWSTRLRMTSSARLIESLSTFDCLVGLAW